MIPLVKTKIPSPDRLMPELERVLYSGYVGQGEKVDEFERKFEKYIGCGHSVSLNSGTAALHIALILAGVNDGDEVISTALTAEPTNVAIKMVGAKIRYADVDIHTTNVSARSILENVTSATKAIVVVDYAGIPVDIDGIQNISKRFGIPVVHDTAHSIGARYKGLPSGSHFPFTAFSFQAIKHITTIDGGMLQVADKAVYEKAKLVRWFGIDKSKGRLENNIKFQGYKYHMNNVNATIGLLQLDDLDAIVNSHIENGKYFDEELRGIPGLELLTYYPNSEPSYWLYTMKVDNRDGFVKRLAEHKIFASELHRRNDWHEYLNDFGQTLPCLDELYPRLVHIPCGWWVGNAEREHIVNTIKAGW